MKKYIFAERRDKTIHNNLKELPEDDKELILNIAFISAFMIEDINERKLELEKILSLANQQGIDLINANVLTEKTEKGANESSYQIQELIRINPVSRISSEDILDLMVNLASDIEFFDSQNEIEALLEKYRMDIATSKNPEISRRQSEMRYTAKDNFYQYNTAEHTKVETYANVAWLANKLAHIFNDAQKRKTIFIAKKQINLKKSLMRIKNFFIHKIIEEKAKGAKVNLSIDTDLRVATGGEFEKCISIVLPHYINPILLHLPKDELSDEEKELCSDDNIDDIYINGIGAIFPLKLMPEKEELLSYLMNNVYNRNTRQDQPHIKRLKYFFENSKKMKKDISNRVLSSKEKRRFKGKNPPKDLIKKNRNFLSQISEKLGISFPEYFWDKMLMNSSYSFYDFMLKIQDYTKECLRLKGFDESTIDEEMYKVFIHMKMTKPVSTLIKQKRDSSILNNAIRESVDEYIVTFEFIRDNLAEFSDYQTMKKQLNEKLKKHRQESESSLKRQEIQELMDKLKKVDVSLVTKKEELSRLQIKMNENKQKTNMQSREQRSK